MNVFSSSLSTRTIRSLISVTSAVSPDFSREHVHHCHRPAPHVGMPRDFPANPRKGCSCYNPKPLQFPVTMAGVMIPTGRARSRIISGHKIERISGDRYTEWIRLPSARIITIDKRSSWAYHSQTRKGGGHAPPQGFGYHQRSPRRRLPW